MKVNPDIEILKCFERDDEKNIFIIREHRRYYKYIIPEYVMNNFELNTCEHSFVFIPYYKCSKFEKQLLVEFLGTMEFNKDRVNFYRKDTVRIIYRHEDDVDYHRMNWLGAVRTALTKAELCKLLMEN